MLAATLVLLGATALAPDVKARLEDIKSEVRAERHDHAIELGEALVKSQPTCSPCFSWLGRAYGQKALKASVFSQLSLAKKCRTSFEKAAELDPSSMDALFDLLSYYRNAPSIAGGGTAKAREVAERIGALSPARGHLAIATIHEKDKEPAKAEAEYRKAVDAEPGEAAFVGSLASFLNRQGRPAEAVEVCRRAAADHPGMPLFRYQVGRVAAITGLEAEVGLKALDDYIAAPPAGEDAPTVADARWRRGQILEKLGKRAEALAEFDAVLAVEPGHQAAADRDKLKPR